MAILLLGREALLRELFDEATVEFALKRLVVERIYHLACPEGRVVAIEIFQIERHHGRNPARAVYYFGVPAKFLHGLYDATDKEDAALVVVGGVAVNLERLPRNVVEEVIVVIYKIYL